LGVGKKERTNGRPYLTHKGAKARAAFPIFHQGGRLNKSASGGGGHRRGGPVGGERSWNFGRKKGPIIKAKTNTKKCGSGKRQRSKKRERRQPKKVAMSVTSQKRGIGKKNA